MLETMVDFSLNRFQFLLFGSYYFFLSKKFFFDYIISRFSKFSYFI